MAETSPERAAAPVTRAELLLLAVVLAGAAFLRLAWWDRGIPGTIFGGEIMTARADAAVQHGGLWAQWWQLARKTQMSSWLFDSPMGLFELAVGAWLLFLGAGPRAAAPAA